MVLVVGGGSGCGGDGCVGDGGGGKGRETAVKLPVIYFGTTLALVRGS